MATIATAAVPLLLTSLKTIAAVIAAVATIASK